jgi:hypothetical protein
MDVIGAVDCILDIAALCLRTGAAEGRHQTLALMHRQALPVGQQGQMDLGTAWIGQARATYTVSTCHR